MRRRVKLSPWLLRMERDCLVGCGCAAPSLPFIQSRKVSEGPRFIERLCEGATPGGVRGARGIRSAWMYRPLCDVQPLSRNSVTAAESRLCPRIGVSGVSAALPRASKASSP